MDMTPQRWQYTKDYLSEVFGRTDDDPQLATLMQRAAAAGLPDIAVSADVGRLLQLLAMMACRAPDSRAKIIEVGTLAGYSGIWLARGLPTHGHLTTIEFEPKHAAFAAGEFQRAGVGERVGVITGAALDVLPHLAHDMGPASIDLAFLDAIKTEYPQYLHHLKPMIRPGGLLIADNALGSGNWWIDAAGDPTRDSVDAFNRAVAADPAFTTACIPIREGVLIARKL
jgi:predicted O-methyltransferase YrrM